MSAISQRRSVMQQPDVQKGPWMFRRLLVVLALVMAGCHTTATPTTHTTTSQTTVTTTTTIPTTTGSQASTTTTTLWYAAYWSGERSGWKDWCDGVRRITEEEDPLGQWEYDWDVICNQSGPLLIGEGLCTIWREEPDLAWDTYNNQVAEMGYGRDRDLVDNMWWIAEMMQCEGLEVPMEPITIPDFSTTTVTLPTDEADLTDLLFLTVIFPYLEAASKSATDMVDLAHSICADLDSGMTLEEVQWKAAEVGTANNWDDATFDLVGAVIGAGVEAYCPQHSP